MADAPQLHLLHLELALISFVLCLFGTILIGKWASRGRWTGRLLLVASRPRSRLVSVFLFLYTCIWLIALVKDPRDFYVITLAPATLIACSGALFASGVVEIRERGIFNETRLIRWNLVKNWHWEGAAKRHMFLWFAAAEREAAILAIELPRRRLFRSQLRVLVRSDRVQAVSTLLKEHVPAEEASSGAAR